MALRNYGNGVAPIVTTYGPGNLHHLTYASGLGPTVLVDVIGSVPTANEGATNFVLGFSYDYTGYAFYWDGAGEAFWRLSNSSFREPVGTSWSDATGLPWSGEQILGLNVAAEAAGATDRGNIIIVSIVPDNLD